MVGGMTREKAIANRPWPQQFLEDFERIGEAIWFFLYLLTRVNGGGCFRASFAKVAGETGVSVVKLKEWLEQLEREGYLKDESLDGKLIVRMEVEGQAAGLRSGR